MFIVLLESTRLRTGKEGRLQDDKWMRIRLQSSSIGLQLDRGVRFRTNARSRLERMEVRDREPNLANLMISDSTHETHGCYNTVLNYRIFFPTGTKMIYDRLMPSQTVSVFRWDAQMKCHYGEPLLIST